MMHLSDFLYSSFAFYSRHAHCRASRQDQEGKGSAFFRRRGHIGGQVMVEYVIMAGILITTVAILSVFLYAFKQHSARVLDLAASEYP